jgi:hypothetical protein
MWFSKWGPPRGVHQGGSPMSGPPWSVLKFVSHKGCRNGSPKCSHKEIPQRYFPRGSPKHGHQVWCLKWSPSGVLQFGPQSGVPIGCPPMGPPSLIPKDVSEGGSPKGGPPRESTIGRPPTVVCHRGSPNGVLRTGVPQRVFPRRSPK